MIKSKFEQKKVVFSLEVFPPKNDVDITELFRTLDQLKGLNLDFISITYGAAGSTSKRTIEIASYIQNNCSTSALAHLTSVSLDELRLKKYMEELKANKIQNVLALRGDRPKDMSDGAYSNRPYKHASDLVRIIRETNEICIGGACYPEIHPEAHNEEEDLYYLKEKVEAGTDFLLTQLFFDNSRFYRFHEKARSVGISVPVSAGIMPVTSINQIKTIIELSGAYIPKALKEIFAKYENSSEDFKKAGIEYASKQVYDLLRNGVQGIHLYTLNKVDVSTELLKSVR